MEGREVGGIVQRQTLHHGVCELSCNISVLSIGGINAQRLPDQDNAIFTTRGHQSPILGTAHAMVSMAAHCIRLAQGRAKHRCLSDYTLFLDIASAYYTLLRQHCVDLTWHDEDIICLLRRLGIDNTHIESVAAMLSSTPAFRTMGVPEPLHGLVAEFHTATWFCLEADDSISSTTAWRWLCRRAMECSLQSIPPGVEGKIQATGSACPLYWNSAIGLLAAEGDQVVHGSCVTWADDIAAYAMTQSADDLIPASRSRRPLSSMNSEAWG